MDFECMKKVIAERHSVRVFSGEPIEEGVMEEILGYSLVFVYMFAYIALSYVYEHSTLQDGSNS